MDAKLIVLAGQQQGREIPLPETIFLIGRSQHCHLRPHCQGVSKLHCAIAAWSGKVRVRDMKSRNGTLLNGQPIHGEVIAGDGDQLQIGTLLFAIRIVDNPTVVPTPAETQLNLKWLLTAPSNSDVLSPSQITRIVSADDLANEEAQSGKAGEGKSSTDKSSTGKRRGATPLPGSKTLSAGPSLRTIYLPRKHQGDTPVNGPSEHSPPESP